LVYSYNTDFVQCFFEADGEKCNKSLIQINQSPARSINGITTYIVEISNTCVKGCKIS